MGLPKPTGWRMLVLPFRMDEKTKGGLLLGNETLDRQQVASQCGNVLAMGDACYKDKERYPNGPWCKVGDWVVFARYAGSRIEIDGGDADGRRAPPLLRDWRHLRARSRADL